MKILYTDGNILTMTNQAADWLIVENERIIEIGTGQAPEANQVIKLDGKTLMPGFINSHMHPLPTGMGSETIHLFECDTFEKVIDSIKKRIKTDNERFLLAEGFLSMVIDFDDEMFNKLNEISKKHPIAIKYITGHGMLLNQNAIDELGVNHYFSNDGDVMAKANDLYDDETVQKFISNVSKEAVSKGFTTIHSLIYGDLYGNRDVPTWIDEEKHHTNLEVQVMNYMQTMDVDIVKNYGLNRIGGCICLDGTPIEGTAAFTEKYDNADHGGELYLEDDVLYDFVEKAHKNDIQCAFHAVGDKAVHQLVDCYQRVVDKYGKKNLRHRIEHVDLISDEKLKQASELGLVFSVQPGIGFLYGQGFEDILGKERTEILNSLRRYKDAGIVLAGGTDSPVTPLDALLGIHAAVHSPFELRRLSVTEALEMFTINGAYAAHIEDRTGSIEVGKYADFVILNEDPHTSKSIKDIVVDETIVRGKRVFKKEQ